MKLWLIIVVLALAAPAAAQDRVATSIFLSGAVLDDVTTWRNMQAGHTEQNPLYAAMNDKPRGVALTLIVTDVVTLWLAHRYTPTHPKLVKAILFALGGVRVTEGAINASTWYADAHRPIFIPASH